MTLKTKVAVLPVAEPLTLEQARSYCRIDPLDVEVDSDGNTFHPDDGLIMALQTAAREWCEAFTGCSIAAKTYVAALDAFPTRTGETGIELPHPPLIEVETLTYESGESEPSALIPAVDFTVDDFASPARLLPPYGAAWPVAAEGYNRVLIRYRAGYGVPGDASDPEPMPQPIATAIRRLLVHLYENRDVAAAGSMGLVPVGIHSLLRPYRVKLGMA
jgi:uncharacterized phiE125 gp8 family phage protein